MLLTRTGVSTATQCALVAARERNLPVTTTCGFAGTQPLAPKPLSESRSRCDSASWPSASCGRLNVAELAAAARAQTRADLAALAEAAAAERAQREEAAQAWRAHVAMQSVVDAAASARPGAFGGALRAARVARNLFVDDAADNLPESGLRQRAYDALVDCARRHGRGWPSRARDRDALHAIERIASRRGAAASVWRVVYGAADLAIRQRWEILDARALS